MSLFLQLPILLLAKDQEEPTWPSHLELQHMVLLVLFGLVLGPTIVHLPHLVQAGKGQLLLQRRLQVFFEKRDVVAVAQHDMHVDAVQVRLPGWPLVHEIGHDGILAEAV